MTTTLYQNTDMILSLTGLKDRSGVAIEDAVVELVTLQDRAGNTPTGIVLPLALAHTENGDYEAQIDAALDVDVGDVLTGTIRETSSAGDSEWQETILVKRRKA